MAERPGRKPRKAHTAEVLRTERLTPHMQRVVLGGEGLAGFAADTCTDHYVKLLFGADGVTYPEPFDVDRIRAEFPREHWPVTRTYTVRAWDPARRELTLDFVVHGDEGLAGPWALRARPGDTVRFLGPGGAYAPDPEADWHLLAGDESALPAIARALETLPAGARAHAFVEVSGPEEEQKIDTEVPVVWLHRGGRPVGEALVEAVRGLEFPEGRMHAFVHGEAGFVKELRRLLRVERQVPREDLSISGYWRLGHDEDGWQASKREWNARIEAEQEGAPAAAA
ncbi:siderophore-interacting protein [Streptomyces cyanogenus]|uniref:Vibriobactin utilization protein ViuB n=1 Tax=Streptomyces cyanogenus TaxID=80860 RepID=A0ABX7TL81_STRCY|nr:siderophore-interacting protein [Streptomyces cyanogenus]QTD97475.1 Vibriobactin utilization protein ViuB [Streptomyces cyanogenus]